MNNDEINTELSAIDKELHQQRWKRINDYVKRHGPLANQLQVLLAYHKRIDFIKSDPDAVRRVFLRSPTDRSKWFSVQGNLDRIHRCSGGGRTEPPPGEQKVNGGDYLCIENMRWQNPLEVGLATILGDKKYRVYPNRFPFMPNHCVCATEIPEPQSPFTGDKAESGDRFRQSLSEFLDLMEQLPEYTGIYNAGRDCGATSNVKHYQVFQQPAGLIRFPLEQAADAALRNAQATAALVPDYPIAVVVFRGRRTEVLDAATNLVSEWVLSLSGPTVPGFNLLAKSRNGSPTRMFDVYFVPRIKGWSRAPELDGMVAAVEAAGEFILTTEEEVTRLKQGQFNYATATRILAAVEPPFVREQIAAILDQTTAPSQSAMQVSQRSWTEVAV